MDTLGRIILSIVERLSYFRSKNVLPLYRSVHWKVPFIQRCPLYTRCPLSEVPLYTLCMQVFLTYRRQFSNAMWYWFIFAVNAFTILDSSAIADATFYDIPAKWPEKSVLIRDVSLFQGLKSTQTWYLGEEESVLFREVSLFQGCPYRGVPL